MLNLLLASEPILAAQVGALDLTFSTVESTQTVGGPVAVDFRVVNNTTSPAAFDIGYNRESGIFFTVIAPDGSWTQVKGPEQWNREGTFTPGQFQIPAGEKYVQHIRYRGMV